MDKTLLKNINLEIIAPVFSPNSGSWKGFYNGKIISFEISDEEFNSHVQNGNIEFKKGSMINCNLIIKKISARNVIYTVDKVNNFRS